MHLPDGTYETLPWQEGDESGLQLYYLDGVAAPVRKFEDIRDQVRITLDAQVKPHGQA